METVLSRWMLVALVGLVLGTIALGLALTTDNRDYTARQAAAVRSCAL